MALGNYNAPARFSFPLALAFAGVEVIRRLLGVAQLPLTRGPRDEAGLARHGASVRHRVVTTRLVIDTDVALGVWHEGRPRDIDDGFAIVEAINIGTIDLRAVTTVYGNAPLADVDRVARELIVLKHAEVPVWRGAAAALPQHGPLPPPNAAVQHIWRELLRDHA